MLTGEPPFTGLNSQAIVAKVLTETPPPLRPKRPTVPPAVEHAVLTALQKLPADRFGSAKDFADALAGEAQQSGSVPTLVSGQQAPGRGGARAPYGLGGLDHRRHGLGAGGLGACCRFPAPELPPSRLAMLVPGSAKRQRLAGAPRHACPTVRAWSTQSCAPTERCADSAPVAGARRVPGPGAAGSAGWCRPTALADRRPSPNGRRSRYRSTRARSASSRRTCSTDASGLGPPGHLLVHQERPDQRGVVGNSRGPEVHGRLGCARCWPTGAQPSSPNWRDLRDPSCWSTCDQAQTSFLATLVVDAR